MLINRMTDILKARGYNLRGRINVYGALAIPPIAVTSGMYFGILRGRPAEDPWQVTATKATIALLSNIPLIIPEMAVTCGLIVDSRIGISRSKYAKKSKLETATAVADRS